MPVPTQGTRIFVRNAAGDTDIEILGHTSISGLNGERSERDRTTLVDEDEVVAVGEVRRYGTVSLALFHEEDDPGQMALEAAYLANPQVQSTIVWLLPTGRARVFNCWVKNWPFDDGGIEQDYKGTISLRVTGGVTKEDAYTIKTGP